MGLLTPVMRAMHKPIYESRQRALVRTILPHLRAGDRVLDVGCGGGALGRAIMDAPDCPKNVSVEGLERAVRGGEPIKVHAYDGVAMPFADGSFDAVIVADVLHHEADPQRLLRECKRITRRLVIIKDHQIKGPLAYRRICFLDWAANAPYGVPCLFRYNTPDEWSRLPRTLGLEVVEQRGSMKVYPPGVNVLLGGALHYFAVLATPKN